MSDKKHGLTGQRNAAKDVKKESFIHARCFSSDKAKWVKKAQSLDLKLTELVVIALNDFCKKDGDA